MNFLPKILFLDLDGTLLDKGFGVWAKISKKNIKEVKKYSEQGIVVISTGRMFSKEIEEIAIKINAKYVVCQNGAIILNQKFEEIQNLTLNQKIVSDIFNLAIKEKLNFVANPGSNIYGNNIWNYIFALFSHFHPKKTIEFKAKELNKILLISNSKKKIQNFHYLLENKFHDLIISKIVGKDYAIEITNRYSSKGIAAEKIANLENIDIKKTIHIGDSMNDSSTKGVVGKLIAMKNGSKKLKIIADEIGVRRQFGGVAKIIQKIKKIN